MSEVTTTAEVVQGSEPLVLSRTGRRAGVDDQPKSPGEPCGPTTVAAYVQGLQDSASRSTPGPQAAGMVPRVSSRRRLERYSHPIRAGAPGYERGHTMHHMKAIVTPQPGACLFPGGKIARLVVNAHGLGSLTHA